MLHCTGRPEIFCSVLTAQLQGQVEKLESNPLHCPAVLSQSEMIPEKYSQFIWDGNLACDGGSTLQTEGNFSFQLLSSVPVPAPLTNEMSSPCLDMVSLTAEMETFPYSLALEVLALAILSVQQKVECRRTTDTHFNGASASQEFCMSKFIWKTYHFCTTN